MNNYFIENIFNQTEKPGQLFPKNVQIYIRTRYDFASRFIKNKDVLEVGCGSGYGLQIFQKLSRNYSGIEYSEENINFIRDKYINSKDKVTYGDAHKLDFKEESKDVIIALAIIYYLEFEKFLKECKKVLRKNGSIIFCTTNKNYPGFTKSPLTKKYYSVPELNLILAKFGFQGEFYGGFPNKRNYLYSFVVGIIKNKIKFIFKKLISNKLLLILKKLNNEKKYELPMNLFDMPTNNKYLKKLDPNLIDKKHLVIYCRARYIGL